MSWDTLGSVFAGAALAGTVVFVALYATVPWWRSPAGRNAMLTAAAFAAFGTLRILRQWFGAGFPLREQIGALGWAVGAWAVGGWVALLLRERRQRKEGNPGVQVGGDRRTSQ